MSWLASDRRFLVNDPDFAPFGLPWMRGVTLARFGLVALVCLIFSLRQESRDSLVALFSRDFLAPLGEFLFYTDTYIVSSLPMLVFVSIADRRTHRASTARRVGALALAVLAGAVLYSAVVTAVFGAWSDGNIWPQIVYPIVSYFLRSLLMGGLLTGVLYYFSRETAAAEALQSTRLNLIALDKQMAEAHLSVLQAQIEPHFLFNTLAHIKRLYAIDAERAKAMLHHLFDYLRAALPQMRENASTLRRELALARAYLAVLQGRMGERLAVTIAVPDELMDAELPPMMLSTLVENAIKHGIAPQPQGGTVKIFAVRRGERLKVSVADDGAGFQGEFGNGVGLANTRARLLALYGAAGELSFGAEGARGVTVSVTLPYLAVAQAMPA